MHWKTVCRAIGAAIMVAASALAGQGPTYYWSDPPKHWWQSKKSSSATNDTHVNSSIKTPTFAASESVKLAPINPSSKPTFKQQWDKFWGVKPKAKAKKSKTTNAQTKKANSNSVGATGTTVNQSPKTGDPFWDSFWHAFFHPLAPKPKTATTP